MYTYKDDKRIIFSIIISILILGSIVPVFAVMTNTGIRPEVETETTVEESVTVSDDIDEFIETNISTDTVYETTEEVIDVVTEIEFDAIWGEPEIEDIIETESYIEEDVTYQETEYIAPVVTVYLENKLPEEHDTVLQEVCANKGVPYEVALALIYNESRFNPYVVSWAGCYGYCQLHPQYFPSGLSPEDNIRYGISWLGDLIAKHGDIYTALTVYAVGHDDGTRWFSYHIINLARGFGYTG